MCLSHKLRTSSSLKVFFFLLFRSVLLSGKSTQSSSATIWVQRFIMSLLAGSLCQSLCACLTSLDSYAACKFCLLLLFSFLFFFFFSFCFVASAFLYPFACIFAHIATFQFFSTLQYLYSPAFFFLLQSHFSTLESRISTHTYKKTLVFHFFFCLRKVFLFNSARGHLKAVGEVA